jgi:hypothetical protein
MSFFRQQILNTPQWTNWEALFSMIYVRYLRDATIELLLEAVYLCGPCRGVLSRTSLEFSYLSWNQSEE